jgi:hypothetical protein
MRNIGEHIDAYAVGDLTRHDKSVDHSRLQVGEFDGTVYNWLGASLNIDVSLQASEELLKEIQKLCATAS